MRLKLIIICLFAIHLSSCARYKFSVMDPWIGASKNELVDKWGYPQSTSDIIKIDEDITVYTYRSFNDGAICAVSFTIVKDIVDKHKFEGDSCPRITRNGERWVWEYLD